MENVIFQTTDKRVLPDVVEMIKKSNIKEVDVKEMAYFIYKNLGNPETRLWVSFNGEKITGFLLAYIVYPVISPEVFIAWAYVDPKEKGLAKQFHVSVENWAKSLKIKKISAIVRKNLKAFQKSFGFNLEYYTVSKEVTI